MKKKLFIVSFIILLIGFIYLLFDNATMLEKSKAAEKLIEEYDKVSERYFSVTDCIDGIEQFELSDGTIAVEVLDIKDCVDKVKESLD